MRHPRLLPFLAAFAVATGTVVLSPAPAVVPTAGAAITDACFATHARQPSLFSNRAMKIRQANGSLIGSRHWALAVSPDGNRVLYIGGTSPNYQLLVADVDGANPRLVYQFAAETPSTGYQYLWSPSGQHVAFLTSQSSETTERLRIVDVAASPAVLTYTSAFEVTIDGYDWAPDGSKVVFADATDVFDGADIWTVAANGTGATRIVDHTASSSALPPWNTPKSVSDLRWSPDGTKIAFSGRNGITALPAQAAPAHEIYVMNENGSNIQEVGTPLGNGPDSSRMSPFWSPDGLQLAYSHSVTPASAPDVFGITIVTMSNGALTEVAAADLTVNYRGRADWLVGGTMVVPGLVTPDEAAFDDYQYGVFSVPVAVDAVLAEPYESQTGLDNANLGPIRCDAVLPGTYTPVVPARLLETRAGLTTADGDFNGIGMRPAGSVTELLVAGRGGVPADATAVVLNVAVTEAQGGGFITAYPCGAERPTAANLNYGAGDTVPNLVIAKVGTGGKVCLYTYAATHMIADVSGAFGPGAMYASLTPARLLESRAGLTTVDGQANGIGLRPAGSVTELLVAGRAGVPDDAAAVVLNIAVTETQGPGFITVFPCGTERPTAANLNYAAGQTIPNLVIAKVGDGGKVCLYTYAATHVIADVNGAFATGTSYQPVVPARLADTRNDGVTVDNQYDKDGKIRANQRLALTVAGRAGIADDASSVVLNIAVTEPDAAGFVTVYPCDSPRPTAANLNYVAGQTVPNLVVAKLAADGSVCIYSLAATHVVVDVNGVFPDY